MFYALSYLQFALVLLSFLMTPLVILSSKKNYKYGAVLVFELMLAQMFMYEPGADVSPYAFVHNGIVQVKLMGMTLSALTSIALDWFVVCHILFRKSKYKARELLVFLLVLTPNTMALLRGDNISADIVDFIKILSPFLLYIYWSEEVNEKNVEFFSNLLTCFHTVAVGQSVLCKVLTGSLSSHNYYHEIAEETMGFYNHPHNFTGLLAFLCLWNVYQINQQKRVNLNLGLFVLSLGLMWFSGTRAYVVALAAGLAVVGLNSLNSPYMKKIRKYVYCGIAGVVVFGPFLLSRFGSARSTNDFSSGRVERWIFDIVYLLRGSISDILIGGGMGHIEDVNYNMVGYRINSLNLFVDDFANYGLIGLILMLMAYFMLFKLSLTKRNQGFHLGAMAIFLTASFINSVTIYMVIMSVLVLELVILKKNSSASPAGKNIGRLKAKSLKL